MQTKSTILSNLWLSLVFLLGGIGFYFLYLRFSEVPQFLWWLFYALYLFGVLTVASYVKVTRRIRNIQKILKKGGLNTQQLDPKETMTLEMLEREVENWTRNQSRLVEELEGREQFRREYIGNVSHELKTPIFNIQGYVLTLLDGAINDPKVATKFLKRAAKSVERMASLIKDMDVLSKVESGQYDIKKEPVHLKNLLEDTVLAVESYAEKRKAKIKFEYRLPKPVYVYCDSPRIEQVMDNLLINAMKYSEQGKTVKLICEDHGSKVLVRVKDKGFGIPEADQSRVFERFYRVDKARSRDQGGSGLGLSIVKHIIDKHGESIYVKSKEGQGTEFAFTLTKQ